jgi:hypothetical protein
MRMKPVPPLFLQLLTRVSSKFCLVVCHLLCIQTTKLYLTINFILLISKAQGYFSLYCSNGRGRLQPWRQGG